VLWFVKVICSGSLQISYVKASNGLYAPQGTWQISARI